MENYIGIPYSYLHSNSIYVRLIDFQFLLQIIKYKLKFMLEYPGAAMIASQLAKLNPSGVYTRGTVSALLFGGYDHGLLRFVGGVKRDVDAAMNGLSWLGSMGKWTDSLKEIPDRFPGLIPVIY